MTENKDVDEGQLAPTEVELGPLGPLDFGSPPFELGAARRVERTRATLAYLLFFLFAGVVVFDLALLAAGTLSPANFDSVTGVLVAPIVGLLGAATGYYYGRGER